MSITVLAAGMLTTVQDSGRSGHAALGVGRAGAMDPIALRIANALVGNDILVGNVDNAAALEITLRGPRLRFDNDTLIAITGANIPAHCGGNLILPWRPVLLHAGSELVLGAMPRGTRSYLAVAGGINVMPVLGSRSTDINSGLGGKVLAAGDRLACTAVASDMERSLRTALGVSAIKGRGKNHGAVVANWSLNPQPWFDPDPQRPVRIVVGTHFPHLDNASQRALLATAFRIDADSNRIGYRLRDATLALRAPLELVSAGVVPGTVQLPPGGDPIVLMAEAPTCGGYPRVAQVIAVDLPRLAQRRPGDTVRFAETSLDEAQTRYLERERALARIAHTVMERLHA
jgi:antagonist of KipI